jgi:hypothetical protein
MPDLSSSRLPTAAVLCGAALFGWSIGGVATFDRDLQSALPQEQARPGHPVADRGPEPHGHRGPDEL